MMKSKYSTGLEKRFEGFWKRKQQRNRRKTGRDRKREKVISEREREGFG